MLRNILRMHPSLAAPEETHFYRWSEPFGTDISLRQFANNVTLRKHRQIDTVTEEEFAGLLGHAKSRRELYLLYMSLFMRKTKPAATRCFDKTPQNVYGAAMLAADFPRARFVHIVRNPLDVVLSLRVGEVMKISSVVGGCNYWLESVTNLHTLKKAFPRRVLELHYEQFNEDPVSGVGRVLDYVKEPFDPAFMDSFVATPKTYDHQSLLSPQERKIVREICGKWATKYGYKL